MVPYADLFSGSRAWATLTDLRRFGVTRLSLLSLRISGASTVLDYS